MTIVEITEAYDGAITAKDICNSNGAVMVPQNSKLTKSMIRRLQNWGITHIEIYNDTSGKTTQSDISSVSSPSHSSIGTIRKKFEQAEHSPYMNQLLEAVETYFTKQIEE